MDTRNDLKPEESAELLDGLRSAPVPEGMARRAVARWADEQTARRPDRPRPALWWRPMVGVAAAALLVLVAVRRGVPPTVAPETAAGRAAAPRVDDARAEKSQRMSAKAAEPEAVPGPTPPSATLAQPLRTRVASIPPRTKAAGRSPSFDAASPMPAAEALADLEIGVRTMIGSSADLAYLNGEPVDAVLAQEAPGEVPDTRLLNAVTLAEEDLRMADLAGVLRNRTGVEIALADQAARDSIAVYCTDKPLREVLRQMARALDLQWTRTGAGDASRYHAILRGGRVDAPEEVHRLSAPMTEGFAGAQGPAPAGAAKGAMSDSAVRRMGAAPRPDTDVSIIGDPAKVRAVLGRIRQARGAPAMPTEGWLILPRDR